MRQVIIYLMSFGLNLLANKKLTYKSNLSQKVLFQFVECPIEFFQFEQQMAFYFPEHIVTIK